MKQQIMKRTTSLFLVVTILLSMFSITVPTASAAETEAIQGGRSVGTTFMAYPNGDSARTGINYRVLTENAATKTGTVTVECNRLGMPPSGSSNGFGVYLGKSGVKDGTITVPGTVVNNGITYTVTELGENVFYEHTATKIELPSTLRVIKKQALARITTSVLEIPEGVEEIGHMVFNEVKADSIILPSTLKKMTGRLSNPSTSAYPMIIYFNGSKEVEFIANGGVYPFTGLNETRDMVIFPDKELYEHYRGRLLKGELTGAVPKTTTTLTYEVNVNFCDYRANKVSLGLPSQTKLWYRNPYYVKDKVTGNWAIDNTNGLPDLPESPASLEPKTYKYWISGVYNTTMIGYGDVLLSDKILATTSQQMSSLSYALSGTFVPEPKQNFSAMALLGVDREGLVVDENTTFSADVRYGSTTGTKVPEGDAAEGKNGTVAWENVNGNPAVLIFGENVADSGTYYISYTYINKYISPYGLYTATGWNLKIDIQPAVIKITPTLAENTFEWANQPTLPAIQPTKDDTEGTYTWDANQVPKEGTHSYNYTFVPDNLRASGVKGTNILNFTEEKKIGSLEITYQDTAAYEVNYAYTGAVPHGAPSVPVAMKVPEGNSVAVASAPTLQGYISSGWSTKDATVSGGIFTMPAKAVAFSGSWAPRTDTKYVVKHWQQDVVGGGYTEATADRHQKTGTSDAAPNIDALNYLEFEFARDKTTYASTGNVASSTALAIAGDGSLVVNLYYNRLLADVDIVVKDENGNAIPGATVDIMYGAMEIRSQTTDTDGKTTVIQIPYGIYNLVVTYKGRILTQSVQVAQRSLIVEVRLDTSGVGSLNTVVDTDLQSTHVAVGGLVDNFSQADKDTVAADVANTVELTLHVKNNVEDSTTDTTIPGQIVITAGKDIHISLFVDITLSKTTTVGNVAPVIVDIQEVDKLLSLSIPIPDSLKALMENGKLGVEDIVVYRQHGTDIIAMTKGTVATPGECYYLDAKLGDYVVIRANKFSTYALGLNMVKKTPPSGGGSTDSDSHTIQASGVDSLLNTEDHLVAYVHGDELGNFCPLASITRAEIAQIFYNLLKNKSVSHQGTFLDVAEDAWYATAIHTLAQLDIVEGIGADRYEPERTITRGEFVTIATRFANKVTGEVHFPDVNKSQWAYNAIATAATYGWVQGYPDGSFHPDADISRSEAVKIVNRMLERTADQSFIDKTEGLKHFPDVSSDDWAYYEIMEASNRHDYWLNAGLETWGKKQ